ncbi:hypothetical protein Tco_0130213, partial [Tanacetum coccineum]
QIYGAILPDVLTNQDMKDFEDYKLYYVVASGAEPPKAKTKYKKKADESDTSPNKNTAPATKGSRLKTLAKVAKFVKKKQPTKKPITKGLTILSEVALSKAEQLKLAAKRSKIQFYISHASGSGDGVDTQSKVPMSSTKMYLVQMKELVMDQSQGDDDDDNDEEIDINDDSKETESDNDEDNFTYLNLLTFKADDQEEEKADDEEVYSDQRVPSPPDYEPTKEEEN